MLNEIIRNIGYDNIIKKISDTIKMENSLYVRIPLDATFKVEEDFLLVKKEVQINQYESAEWYKQREIYCERIMPNKSIVISGKFPKIISSCNSNAIMFNWKKFKEHKNTDSENLLESFKVMICEFLKKLDAQEKITYYENSFNSIKNYIEENKLSNILIKLFLDTEISEYKEAYIKYLNNKLFDDGTNTIIDNIEVGRLSLFYTLNSKKPYLSHMLNNTEEVHLLDSKDAEQIFQLKKYMDETKNEVIETGTGKIKYVMDFNNNTKKWFLDDYIINPTQEVDNIPVLNLFNIMNGKNYEEKQIKKRSDLTMYILEMLQFKIKDYYSENDKTEIKFKTFSLMYNKYIKNIDVELFKRIYSNFIKNIYKLYIDEESVDKVRQIINFDVCMGDYLYGTNKKKGFETMIEEMKLKIKQIDKENEYIIENNEEFYILCGQLAKYLKLKTKTDKITNDLFSQYYMAIRTERLVDVLQNDKARFDYESGNNSRSGKILYSINKYYLLNKDSLKKIDRISFNMGLYYGDCVLYATDKEKRK